MAPVFLIVAGLAVLLLMGGKKAQASGTSTGTVPNGKGGMTPVTPSSAQGLTRDEIVKAVQNALAYETDPHNLREFADSLLPDYATYARQLNAKADAIDNGNAPGPTGPTSPASPVLPSPQAPQAPETPDNPAPPPVVVPNDPPTPASFPSAGSTAFVVTHDAGPTGNLKVRSAPDLSGTVLTQVGHGTSVLITGDEELAADNTAWFPVRTPAGIDGYAFADFLGATPPADAPLGPAAGQELVAQDGQPLAGNGAG